MPRRTASDKVLHDQTFNIAKNPKYDGYKRGITLSKRFAKSTASGSGVKNENMSNPELAKESHKPIVRKIEKRKSSLIFCRRHLGC